MSYTVDGVDYVNYKCPECQTNTRIKIGGELKKCAERPKYRFHCTNKSYMGEVCGEKFTITLLEFKDKVNNVAVCPKCGADVQKHRHEAWEINSPQGVLIDK